MGQSMNDESGAGLSASPWIRTPVPETESPPRSLLLAWLDLAYGFGYRPLDS
jgi:hypothetical protein